MKAFDYTQTVIGDCGHLCMGWPLRSRLGGREPRVICDDCTRIEYGIEPGEGDLVVWVHVQEEKPKPSKPRKKTAKPLAGQQGLWDRFL